MVERNYLNRSSLENSDSPENSDSLENSDSQIFRIKYNQPTNNLDWLRSGLKLD